MATEVTKVTVERAHEVATEHEPIGVSPAERLWIAHQSVDDWHMLVELQREHSPRACRSVRAAEDDHRSHQGHLMARTAQCRSPTDHPMAFDWRFPASSSRWRVWRRPSTSTSWPFDRNWPVTSARRSQVKCSVGDISALGPLTVPEASSTLARVLVLRLLLLAAAGLLGGLIGGFVGGMAGVGISLLIIAADWSQPGGPLSTIVWGFGMVGSILGMVASVLWLASWTRRKWP